MRFPKTFAEAQAQISSIQNRLSELRTHVDVWRYPVTSQHAQEWLYAPATHTPRTALLLTAGVHGIEGYVGLGVLDVFVREFLPRLDERTVGVAIVPMVNPWGMEHMQRTNAQHVDLNRNFLTDPAAFDPEFNPDYQRLRPFLAPDRPVSPTDMSLFWARVLRVLLGTGLKSLRNATMLGQYSDPKGLLYGGDKVQPETRAFMEGLDTLLSNYEHLVHIDIHTGYGPRHEMLIIFPHEDRRSLETLRTRYAYPRVVKTSGGEFYQTQGSLGSYVYRRAQEQHPGKEPCVTSLEFGTFGNSTPASLRSLRALVLHNQLQHHGVQYPVQYPHVRERILREFRELFMPSEPAWYEHALERARQGLQGLLTGEQLIAIPEHRSGHHA